MENNHSEYHGQSDRDLLIRTCTNVEWIKQNAEDITERVESLEKKHWWFAGAVAAIVGAVQFIFSSHK